MGDRFFRLPEAVLYDDELTNAAKVTYAIMLDVSRGGIATISLARIAERLGKSRSVAKLSVKGLTDRKHIEKFGTKNGAWVARYKLLHNCEEKEVCERCSGVASKPGYQEPGLLKGRDPDQKSTATRVANDPQSKLRSLNSIPKGSASGKKDDEPSEDLVELVRQCGKNGTAYDSARFAFDAVKVIGGGERRLIDWLKFFLKSPEIADPLEQALRKTLYGDTCRAS